MATPRPFTRSWTKALKERARRTPSPDPPRSFLEGLRRYHPNLATLPSSRPSPFLRSSPRLSSHSESPSPDSASPSEPSEHQDSSSPAPTTFKDLPPTSSTHLYPPLTSSLDCDRPPVTHSPSSVDSPVLIPAPPPEYPLTSSIPRVDPLPPCPPLVQPTPLLPTEHTPTVSAPDTGVSPSTSAKMAFSADTVVLDLLAPDTFSGSNKDNASQWIARLERHLSLRGRSPDQLCVWLPLYLKGHALEWYDSLSKEVQTSAHELKTAFLGRFHNPTTRWTRVDKFLSRAQRPGEPVDSYYHDMIQMGTTLGKDIDACVDNFVRGLLPHIRAHVMLKEPSTMSEAFQHARLAESVVPIPVASSDVNSNIQSLRDEVHALFTSSSPHVQTLQSPFSSRSQPQRPQYPTPRPQRYNSSFSRPRYSNSQPPRHQRFSFSSREPSHTPHRQRPPNTRDFPKSCCYRCDTNHQGPCPYVSHKCDFCNKIGHSSLACFARKAQASAPQQYDK